MGLSDIGATLPPGFRFYPSDEELVCHYLYKKIANEDVSKGTLMEIDLHTCEPWQLPEVAKLNSSEWYFFSFRDRKYATGYRTNRATISGYWKATGKDRTIADPRTRVIVGMRKTLVFYKNRAPNGIKTGWIMHEFRLENPNIPPKEDWVLCRVFYKAKGENSNELSPPRNTYENFTAGANSPPNLGASSSHSLEEVYQTLMPSYGYNYQKNQISCSSNFSQSLPQNPNNLNTNFLATLSPYNPTFLQLSRGGSGVEDADPIGDDIIMSSSTRCDQDQYGFLFDMGFGDSHHLGFDDDDDDDNGRVFF